MKAWVGIEREGKEQGLNTLFISAASLNKSMLYWIQSAALRVSAERIYFGAGKRDLKFIDKSWEKILEGFKVVIETSRMTYGIDYTKFDTIILRQDIPYGKEYKNVVTKVDNGKSVTLYYEGIETSLKSVKDGKYTDTDTELKMPYE